MRRGSKECRPANSPRRCFSPWSDAAAAFAQIGDGAIVVGGEGVEADDSSAAPYRLVFQPDSGEYVNETSFLTQSDFAERIQVVHLAARIEELAVLSDGLQRLALDLARGRPYPSFFLPMFAAPTRAPTRCRGRWSSSSIRRASTRTDDDKTLILAQRQAPPHSESHDEALR